MEVRNTLFVGALKLVGIRVVTVGMACYYSLLLQVHAVAVQSEAFVRYVAVGWLPEASTTGNLNVGGSTLVSGDITQAATFFVSAALCLLACFFTKRLILGPASGSSLSQLQQLPKAASKKSRNLKEFTRNQIPLGAAKYLPVFFAMVSLISSVSGVAYNDAGGKLCYSD